MTARTLHQVCVITRSDWQLRHSYLFLLEPSYLFIHTALDGSVLHLCSLLLTEFLHRTEDMNL
jgi:hypothetical protein